MKNDSLGKQTWFHRFFGFVGDHPEVAVFVFIILFLIEIAILNEIYLERILQLFD